MKAAVEFAKGGDEVARAYAEAAVPFAPLGAGQTALGMRLNKVHWFKGAILRVRITRRALPDDELMKP